MNMFEAGVVAVANALPAYMPSLPRAPLPVPACTSLPSIADGALPQKLGTTSGPEAQQLAHLPGRRAEGALFHRMAPPAVARPLEPLPTIAGVRRAVSMQCFQAARSTPRLHMPLRVHAACVNPRCA